RAQSGPGDLGAGPVSRLAEQRTVGCCRLAADAGGSVPQSHGRAAFGRGGLMTAYLALLISELRVSMRERSVLFFNYLFPLVFFFMFGELTNARASLGSAQFIVSTVLAIGVMGNGFFGMGMRAVQERELGILRRLRLAP